MWIHRRVVTVLQMLKFPKQKGEREEGERAGERKEWKKGKREGSGRIGLQVQQIKVRIIAL